MSLQEEENRASPLSFVSHTLPPSLHFFPIPLSHPLCLLIILKGYSWGCLLSKMLGDLVGRGIPKSLPFLEQENLVPGSGCPLLPGLPEVYISHCPPYPGFQVTSHHHSYQGHKTLCRYRADGHPKAALGINDVFIKR